ncbi:MAG TPA: saccharopine dehydrogenase C-terminal domain-containing protein [Steroidobacteraceae bacterium]|jgi:homospermidine synthase|nr:saccharopine dehydrogenase C-terminal domain-containing protein [Steroidobacteraceae bacterium]
MNNDHKIHVEFPGRILLVGFGSVGQGVLPLILRHIGIAPERLTIVTAEDKGNQEAAKFGIRFIKERLTRENFRRVLNPLLGRGDFLVNVSVEVASVALIKLCWEKGAMYIDTCLEPWPGGYTDPTVPVSRRTNYALREEALALRNGNERAPTAVLTHGANPGLVSHFVKQALLNLASDAKLDAGKPATRAEWGELARRLGVKVIHIAERDTQLSGAPKQAGEFVNTWSIDGFVSEGSQPSEVGWGTHERNFPRDGKRHDFGCLAAIYLMQPGAATRVRTWTPRSGHFHGFCITHGESISIADYYTVRDGAQVVYRPTVHYAYHPCDAAVMSMHELAGRNYVQQERQRILMDDIIGGIDELGVLLAGHRRNAYWYGSQLSVAEARKLAPYNNATSLQVTVAVLSGVIWAMENPNLGIVEPDAMDFRRNLDICMPYLGPVCGEYTDWTPLHERERLFPEDVDKNDPWQFKNVRVIW